nr:NAD(P)-dependent oxidoreductase [uncultured Agathobaculum sp.]
MKILLTGASGFIGKNIYEHWNGIYDIVAPRHSELDLTDASAVECFLKKWLPDIVIHSANTNDIVHPERAAQTIEYNLRMFNNLARCEPYFGKMLYFGSGAEYDMRHYIPKMREEYFDTYVPADPYGFSKYLMTKIAQKTKNIYNLRLFGIFGPYEEWNRRFISNMIYKALTKQPMKMGKHIHFDYLYIKDLFPVLEWFIYNTPQYKEYNVCSGQPIDLYCLGQLICKVLDKNRAELQCETGWKLDYTGDNSRLCSEMGSTFQTTPMEQAIQEMIQYYKTYATQLWKT